MASKRKMGKEDSGGAPSKNSEKSIIPSISKEILSDTSTGKTDPETEATTTKGPSEAHQVSGFSFVTRRKIGIVDLKTGRSFFPLVFNPVGIAPCGTPGSEAERAWINNLGMKLAKAPSFTFVEEGFAKQFAMQDIEAYFNFVSQIYFFWAVLKNYQSLGTYVINGGFSHEYDLRVLIDSTINNNLRPNSRAFKDALSRLERHLSDCYLPSGIVNIIKDLAVPKYVESDYRCQIIAPCINISNFGCDIREKNNVWNDLTVSKKKVVLTFPISPEFASESTDFHIRTLSIVKAASFLLDRDNAAGGRLNYYRDVFSKIIPDMRLTFSGEADPVIVAVNNTSASNEFFELNSGFPRIQRPSANPLGRFKGNNKIGDNVNKDKVDPLFERALVPNTNYPDLSQTLDYVCFANGAICPDYFAESNVIVNDDYSINEINVDRTYETCQIASSSKMEFDMNEWLKSIFAAKAIFADNGSDLGFTDAKTVLSPGIVFKTNIYKGYYTPVACANGDFTITNKTCISLIDSDDKFISFGRYKNVKHLLDNEIVEKGVPFDFVAKENVSMLWWSSSPDLNYWNFDLNAWFDFEIRTKLNKLFSSENLNEKYRLRSANQYQSNVVLRDVLSDYFKRLNSDTIKPDVSGNEGV